MSLILFGLDFSPPVRSVKLIIHALDLSAEFKTVNLMEKEHLTQDYLKMNPIHTIPTIDDDGFILWESRAIMTYLVSKYGEDDSLYPKDLKKRAIVDQRLHYSNDVFYPLRQVTQGIVLYNMVEVPPELLVRIKENQASVEKLLEGNRFIAGDSLTVADYSFITLMDSFERYSPMKDQFPLTKAWIDRCKSTMKDYDKVNQHGISQWIAKIKGRVPF